MVTEQLNLAGQGVERTPITMDLGKAGFGSGIAQIGTRYSNPLGAENIVQGMIQDREMAMGAAEDQRRRDQLAKAQIEGGARRAAGSMRQDANALPGRVQSITQPIFDRTTADVNEIQQRSRELDSSAAQRRSESLSQAEQLSSRAMGEFRDDTAAAIQTQRLGLNKQVSQQRADILSQANAQGLSADDPVVQQQLAQVNASASQQSGQMAMEAFQRYNQQSAALRNNYDQMQTANRQAADASAARGGEQAVSGLIEAQKLRQYADAGILNSRMQAESMRMQTLATADQLEYQGDVMGANVLRAMDATYSPIAPLIASAYSMYEGEISGELGAFAANSTYSPYGEGVPGVKWVRQPRETPGLGMKSKPDEGENVDAGIYEPGPARGFQGPTGYSPQ
jgi:hypothetical protein